VTADGGSLPSAVAIAAGVAGGQLSVNQVAQQALARIRALDPRLHAWVCLNPALEAEARTLDAEAAARRPRGPLHGVPIGVKDIFDVAGMSTRANSRLLAEAPPASADADCVARLRAAGALLVGKTATTEFAYADAAQTLNPWNPGHTPGGSSSGSAAAVAAGMVPAALGTQTAGSVLRPAAFCGIVGFKPSRGTVSRRGVYPLAWSLDTVGTLTRSVADARLLFGALSGPTQSNETALPPRLGYLADILPDRLQPAMGAALDGAAEALQRAGATLAEVTLPQGFAAALEAHHVIMIAEAAAYHLRSHGDRLDLLGPRLRDFVAAGSVVSGTAYLDAQRVRNDLITRTLPLFERCDALLAPAAPGPAPAGLASTGDPAFNAPWTLLGLPAITLCAGFDGGLPLGLQLVGPPGSDWSLLALAEWCERTLPPAPRPPLE